MRKKAITLAALVLGLVLLAAPLATAQDTNEWGQYQRDKANTGFMDVDVPTEGKVSGQTPAMDARDGSQPVVAGSRVFVYTGVDDASGSVACFDLATGAKVWETGVAPPTSWSWSSPAVSGGLVYIGSGSFVYALDALDGKKVWTRSLGAGSAVVNSSPTVDGGRVFIGDWNTGNRGRYLCLDALTGKVLWEFALGAGTHAQSTPAVDGDRVYVGQFSAVYGVSKGRVWCLDRGTGKPVASWGSGGSFRTVGDLDVTGSVSVFEESIYFTDFAFGAASSPNSHLYCLNKATGAQEWRTAVYPSSGAPAVADGMVVVAANQSEPSTNWTYAFAAKPGAGGSAEELWKRKDIGGFNMSAAIADGKVLVGNVDVNTWANSGIHCLEAGSGKTAWSSEQAGSVPVPTEYGVLSIGGGKMTTFGTRPAGTAEYYFAEGCTLPGYQEWICLQNATANEVNANIRYMLADGTTADQPVTLPAESRTTVDVNLFLGPGREAAAHVTGDGPFVAERAMYVDTGGISGGEQVMGVTEPKKSFLFAEGTTRSGYQTWLALQNPGTLDADAIITYYYADGEPKAENVTVPAASRKTIDVNASAGAEEDVSIAVTANSGMVAERVMYFRDTSPILGASPAGVHNSTGADRAATGWYFAEGTTRSNFNEWLCLLNPGGQDALVTVRYLTFDRGVVTKSRTVPANSRVTVNVNEDVGAETDLSIQVESSRPVVAERPMYFQYLPGGTQGGPWGGGHNTVGARYTAYEWEFAEGTTRPGFHTYLCVSNPNAREVEVTVTYITNQDGARDAKTDKVTVAANSRHTIMVNEAVGEGKDVSFKVSSGVPVVVERPMYFSNGEYAGGGVSLGLTEAP